MHGCDDDIIEEYATMGLIFYGTNVRVYPSP
jgi:hypothetical protein